MRFIRTIFWRQVWREAHAIKDSRSLLEFALAMFSDNVETHKKHGFTVIARAP